jgi:hypothetical protein
VGHSACVVRGSDGGTAPEVVWSQRDLRGRRSRSGSQPPDDVGPADSDSSLRWARFSAFPRSSFTCFRERRGGASWPPA